MATPIRKLYMLRNYREAHYQLTQEARDRLWKKIEEDETSLGAKLLISCDSRWCNEAYAGWGVIEYPDIQAVQKTTAINENNELFRYVDSESYLGLPASDNSLFTSMDSIKITPETVFELFLIKNLSNDPWESLSQDTRARIWAALVDSMDKNGGKGLFWCHLDWSNEEYANYGIIAWPNVEAVQAHFENQRKIGWNRYVYGKTILGKKSE